MKVYKNPYTSSFSFFNLLFLVVSVLSFSFWRRVSFACFGRNLGRCLLLLLRIRSAHLKIHGFPMGGAY